MYMYYIYISINKKRELSTYHIRVFLDISHAGFSAVDRDFGFQLQDAPAVVDSHDYLLMSLVEVVDFEKAKRLLIYSVYWHKEGSR